MSEKEQSECMNAWLAIGVMGWKLVTSISDFNEGTFMVNTEGECQRWAGYCRSAQWNPVENKSDAMEVLEKCLIEKSDEFDIKYIAVTRQWRVRSSWLNIPTAIADTLPLAIAIAARKLFEKV